MSDVVKPPIHGRDHRPGGSDPIPGLTPSWVSVYDNNFYGQAITSSSSTQIQFPYIDWSDNASGVFSYVRSASTIGASNNYNPSLLIDGIFAITLYLRSDQVSGGSNYEIVYTLDTNAYYPGRKSSTSLISDRIPQTFAFEDSAGTARSYSQPYFDYQRTIVIPLQRISGSATLYPYAQVLRPGTASDVTVTIDSRMWITYLGPLQHSATLNSSNDPYPTTP